MLNDYQRIDPATARELWQCRERTGECELRPRDDDDDDHAAVAAGGDDCDDRDPNAFPARPSCSPRSCRASPRRPGCGGARTCRLASR
ncbi:MAG: hypothetical protein M5U28_03025 [Sandaracinaceae bacterium]|nr:hypothetical protein [Sandaracinaceae bacterium]